jgi:signal transduction histidine kinase
VVWVLFWVWMVGVLAGELCAAEPLCRSIQQLRSLTRGQALEWKAGGGTPVVLDGVITYVRVDENRVNFNLDDGTGGVMVYVDRREPFQLGQRVHVAGYPDFLRHGLCLRAKKWQVGAEGPMPQPLSATLADLAGGGLEGRYVEVEASVRRVRFEDRHVSPRRLSLDLGTETQPVHVWITEYEGAENRYGPGMLIRVRGVCLRWGNARGQGLSTVVLANHTGEVVVQSDAPEPVEMTIRDVQEWLGAESRAPRVVCEGVVTLLRPGQLMVIQEGDRALRCRPLQPDPAANHREQWRCEMGDRVRVTGFPAMGEYTMELEYAEVQTATPGELPAAEHVERMDQIFSGKEPVDRDGRRVEVGGVLIGIRNRMGETVLELQGDSRKYEASLPAESRLPVALRPGAELRLDGICSLQLTPLERRFGLAPSECRILVPTPDGIRVIRGAPWWTNSRLVYAGLGTGLVAILAVWWAVVLKSKNREMKRLMEARWQAEQRLEKDRERMASELHDTLQQTLLAAGLQLSAANRFMSERPQEAAGAVQLASRLVVRGREEMREAVWALKREPVSGLGTAIREICEEASGAGGVQVRYEQEGAEVRLGGLIFSNGVRLVKEAVSNAIRHSGAAEVRVRFCFADSGLQIEVTDHGAGFDPETCRGSESGHFGISGMRERVARLGGHFSLESTPGAGTRLRIRIPMEEKA